MAQFQYESKLYHWRRAKASEKHDEACAAARERNERQVAIS